MSSLSVFVNWNSSMGRTVPSPLFIYSIIYSHQCGLVGVYFILCFVAQVVPDLPLCHVPALLQVHPHFLVLQEVPGPFCLFRAPTLE